MFGKKQNACDLLKKLNECIKEDKKKVEACMNLQMVDVLKDTSICKFCFIAIIDVAKSVLVSKIHPIGFIRAIIRLIRATLKGECKCLDNCDSFQE